MRWGWGEVYIVKANENQLKCCKFIGTTGKNCITKSKQNKTKKNPTYIRSERSSLRTQCKFMKHLVV